MASLRRSLVLKLILAFLAVSLITLVLFAVASATVTFQSFSHLVSQEATNAFLSYVADYYTTHGSLAGLDEALRRRPEQRDPQPGSPVPIFPTPLTDPEGVVLIGAPGIEIGQKVPPETLASAQAITVDDQVIAYSLPRSAPPTRTREQERFIQTTLQTVGLAGLGAALVAILLGALIARTITRPVAELTRAVRGMAPGDLGRTVQVSTRDEVGELAQAFNQMSASLARADQLRRQMTADIAHELRNPLTVMSGYLEAMSAGELAPTPSRLEKVYGEILHLQRLVEDLRLLSLAEAGALTLNRDALKPESLLNRAAATYAQQAAQKGIAMAVQAAPDLPEVDADEVRMVQVLDNLLSNALRHTPPQGQVRLSAALTDGKIQFAVTDTGEGIRVQDLPRVFERFYRGDAARSGGDKSGLGLAIAKALVEAHRGRIWVESAPGEGATFRFELPVKTRDTASRSRAGGR